MTQDQLFKKIGAAQKAMEEAKNAIDYAHAQGIRFTRREGKLIQGYLAQVQVDAWRTEAKAFRMTPGVRLVVSGKRIRLVEY